MTLQQADEDLRQRAAPFAPASVSLGLHPVSDLPARDQVDALIAQAVTAEGASFDGVTLSEHHAGLPGYLPQPLLASNWLLSATDRIWSGPAPILLSLRNAELLAEELAWSAARFPGRFGAGVAAGYAEKDVNAVGLAGVDLKQQFAEGLVRLSQALSPEGPLSGDAAVDAWVEHPCPLVSAAHSPVAARRAADVGMGVLLIGSSDDERARRIMDAYSAAGGTGPAVWIRRIFVGRPSASAIRELEAAYGSWDNASKGSVNEFVNGSAEEIAEVLRGELNTLGPRAAVNVRVHLPGVSPTGINEQIEQVGSEVLPLLRG